MWVDQIIQNITNVGHAEKPDGCRYVKTIHHSIGHAFHELITIFGKILMFMLGFTLPETGVGIAKIFGDFPTSVERCVISNEFCRGTTLANAVLKGTQETLGISTLNLKNVSDARNQTNKNIWARVSLPPRAGVSE